MQVMHHFCSKNTIPLKHTYIQPFPVKLHKYTNIKTLSMPLWKQIVYDFIKVSIRCFVPFCSHQS